tara:strand:+ start:886 stop:1254 length:369 start_codon:yes stop_codon:yes gene_type:complete
MNEMFFDLSILLPNLEMKKTKVNLSDFLDIDKINASYLNSITKFSYHLNHAELIIEKILIKGKIRYNLDVEGFIHSLLKFEKKLNNDLKFKQGEWNGEFYLFLKNHKYIYRAPCFKQETTKI